MAILIKNIATEINDPPQAAIEQARRILRLNGSEPFEACITKTSLDARRRDHPHFVHTVSVTLTGDEQKVAARAKSALVSVQTEQPLTLERGTRPLAARPVIAGFGPAGMFAGLLLAREGYRPIILERGGAIDDRVRAVEGFWKDGAFDSVTNVQFGEGGAGTFSDGKLTTRIGDARCGWILRELVKFGAPQEILQKAKPHIGTDRLRGVVKAIRAEILSLGGEVRFLTQLTGLQTRDGQIASVSTPEGEFQADALILATGHSARDTFELLLREGFALEAKAFSVGVRAEHLQVDIDRGLYGPLAGNPVLPIGEYQLSHREGERGVYTFCMCPGGVVVPAASEEGRVVTNGMSCYARDGANANAAVVVSVTPDDFGKHPLDGVAFQRMLEERAFVAGGGGYRAPAQDVGCFLRGERGLHIGRVQPTYARGISGTDFGEIFPEFVTEMLKKGLRTFGQKLPGYAAEDTLLTGVETRTSSPVRVLRGENCQAIGVSGVYPCAEGAGYAGGIMSAAVDGLRCAQALIAEAAPPVGE